MKEDWSGVKFPDSLVELQLKIPITQVTAFPKSLHTLTIYSPSPVKSLNLVDLENLVQLKVAWSGMLEFICKLPNNLKTLDLSDARSLNKVIIEAPNLKRVNLIHTELEYLDASHFHLPDCVELVSIQNSKGFKKIESNILPSLLRELSLCLCRITSEILDRFEFENYENLENLDLHENEISQIRSNSLPCSLKSIRLDKNPISSFSTPTVLLGLRNLQYISLISTKINEYFQSDGSLLYFPSSLTRLDLADNDLQAGVAAKSVFLTCTQLQELCLFGNPGMTDVQIIIDIINSSSPNMVELVLDCLVRRHFKEEGIDFEFMTCRHSWY